MFGRLTAAVALSVLLAVSAPSESAESQGSRTHAAVERLAADARPYLKRWGYAAVFGAIAIEAVGIPAPGHTMLIAAALAAARGTLDIRLVLLTGAIATVVGSQLAWIIGRRASELVRRRSAAAATRLSRTEQAFARWGGLVVVFGPFVEGIRQLNALAAGALEMPWARFTLCNLAGAALWVGVWGAGTWILVDNMAGALAVANEVRPWLLAVTAAAAASGVVWVVRRRRRST